MPMYMVHVFCNHCSQPHPSGIAVNLAEDISKTQSVGDIYDGRELPGQIVTMTSNYFTCPNTGKMYQQKDNKQVFLVRFS
jgi:hypothetical protein